MTIKRKAPNWTGRGGAGRDVGGEKVLTRSLPTARRGVPRRGNKLRVSTRYCHSPLPTPPTQRLGFCAVQRARGKVTETKEGHGGENI